MKVAAAQIAPVFLNREATLAKVCDAIAEAGRGGARLVAFGESLVPAYPLWLCRTDGARFDAEDQKQLYACYADQAVDVSAGQLDGVCEAARRAEAAVVLGIAERDPRRGHTVFCTRVIIDGRGEILSAHRKLMPTYEERLAWGQGDGAGLVTHALGEFRVGALNCWENWMPLPRAALYAQGEELHVMLWPGCVRLTNDITRYVAREGRMFVVSASGLIRPRDLPADVPQRARICAAGEEVFYDGGSCIAGPDGQWLVPPAAAEETILYADLDPAAVRRERQSFDPAGHYARPDVTRLIVDRTRQVTAEFREG